MRGPQLDQQAVEVPPFLTDRFRDPVDRGDSPVNFDLPEVLGSLNGLGDPLNT
jgi:hypothetical protein